MSNSSIFHESLEEGTAGLLQAAARGAPIILWSVDAEGIFTFAEGRALDGLGLKPGQGVGTSIFEMFPDRPDIHGRIRAALAGETQHTTTQIGENFYETWEFPGRDPAGMITGVLGVSTDVTERIRAEQERSRSQELFRTVFLTGAVGILLVEESDGSVIDANPECLRIFERPREDVIGRTTVELGLWPNAERRLYWNRTLLDNGETYSRLHRITTGSGRQRIIRYWGRLVPQQQRECVVALMYDATAEFQLKRRLRRSRRLYRTLTRSSPVGIFNATARRGWNYVNGRLCGLAGVEADSLKGDGWLERVSPLDRVRVRNLWQGALRTLEPFRDEFRFVRPDGEVLWVYAEAEPQGGRADGESVWVGTATDITRRMIAEQQLREANECLEQRIAERTQELVEANAALRMEAVQRQETLRALEESEARWRSLVMHAPDFILQVDREGTIEFANRLSPSATTDSVVGLSMFDFVNPEVADEIRTILERVFAHGTAHHTTLPVNGNHGVTGWFSTMYSPVFDGDQVDSALVSSRDVTAEKQAEAELSQVRSQVAHAARVSAAGEMTAAIAHELNQPLLAIANYAAGCINRLSGENLPRDQLVGRLEEIRAAAVRGGEIIRRLRGFVERRDDESKVCDLTLLIQDAIRLIQPQASHRAIRCRTTIEAPLPPVRVDPIQVVQVIVNLILNGIEAMDETPVDLRVVRVSAGCDGDRVWCSVSDAGRGIPAELGERIFEAFVSTKTGGMGIGLSISRTIIQSQGGELTVQSHGAEPGVTFTFSLPVDNEEHK